MISGTLFLNPVALRKTKIVCNFGLSECSRVKASVYNYMLSNFLQRLATFENISN